MLPVFLPCSAGIFVGQPLWVTGICLGQEDWRGNSL